MDIPFHKMQGIGNDFIVVEERACPGEDLSALAVALCARRFSIGSDGLLVIDRTENADLGMRMFNPDGTPDFCGNGLRCVARYGAEVMGLGPGPLTIATASGIRTARVAADGSGRVETDMQPPDFRPDRIPMDVPDDRAVDYPLTIDGETLTVTSLSTGTAHTVIFVEALPDDEPFRRLSALIADHPLYPLRTSVLWTRVEGADRLSLRIWERGIGETLGCGTGACAAMAAARVRGCVDADVIVGSPGGELQISWDGGTAMTQAGPAAYVYDGIVRR